MIIREKKYKIYNIVLVNSPIYTIIPNTLCSLPDMVRNFLH